MLVQLITMPKDRKDAVKFERNIYPLSGEDKIIRIPKVILERENEKEYFIVEIDKIESKITMQQLSSKLSSFQRIMKDAYENTDVSVKYTHGFQIKDGKWFEKLELEIWDTSASF